MNVIRAVWKGGQLVPRETVDWPDGCEALVEPLEPAQGRIGIDESEWSDDAASLADWTSWILSVEPLELTAEELCAHDQFADEMRRHNVDAVRRQMGLSSP